MRWVITHPVATSTDQQAQAVPLPCRCSSHSLLLYLDSWVWFKPCFGATHIAETTQIRTHICCPSPEHPTDVMRTCLWSPYVVILSFMSIQALQGHIAVVRPLPHALTETETSCPPHHHQGQGLTAHPDSAHRTRTLYHDDWYGPGAIRMRGEVAGVESMFRRCRCRCRCRWGGRGGSGRKN